MGLGLFEAVPDYPTMLNKIAWGTFFSSLLLLVGLRAEVSPVHDFFDASPLNIDVAGVQLPLCLAVPALVLAMFSRVFKLHDLISTAFSLRLEFDVEAILLPLAMATGYPQSESAYLKLKAARGVLMADTFYAYASSSAPQIDKHLVTLALDNWSWYWILLEACLWMTLAWVCAMTFLAFGFALAVFTGFLLAQFAMAAIRKKAVSYARSQVDAILKDPSRAQAVRARLNALPA